MANPSQIPIAGLPVFRSAPKRNAPRLQPVPAAPPLRTTPAEDTASLPITGPRKLVRPPLPARAFRSRTFSTHQEPAILAHQGMSASSASHESSNAEAFYFQKQVQSQTRMVVVLEDGEQITGCIEWYDRNAIKVKNSSRVLIYKAAIKYIYKAAEKQG